MEMLAFQAMASACANAHQSSRDLDERGCRQKTAPPPQQRPKWNDAAWRGVLLSRVDCRVTLER